MKELVKIGTHLALLLAGVYVVASALGVAPRGRKGKGGNSNGWQLPNYGNVATGMGSELIQSPGMNPALVGVPLVGQQ